MKSIRELYKIGNGPSSSHTMGPEKACRYMKEKNKEADHFVVYLYGSLALTGKGHLTDYIIKKTFGNIPVKIIMDLKSPCDVHPNTMDIEAYKNMDKIDSVRVYSVGGSAIKIEGRKDVEIEDIYEHTTLNSIKEYIEKNNITLLEYIYNVEGGDFKNYLKTIWDVMKESVISGLEQEGVLPGKLNLQRRAKSIFENVLENETAEIRRIRLVTSYTYAVSENNASGGKIVTAPTCGASGVLPGMLYYLKETYKYSEEEIIDALAVAGLIGNLVKENASISGAECGCQAEVGTACSMAAAAYAQLLKLPVGKIDIAAEIAMEHHLGLTCDPIYGYVQIPCIERNAVAAIRAMDSANIAMLYKEENKISFDLVIETMYETGKDLKSHYRETSTGGLAKKYCRNKFYNKEIE